MTAAEGAAGAEAWLTLCLDGFWAVADMGKDLSGDTKRKRPRLGAALFDDPATVRHRSRANARTPGRRLRWIE
jgi:hypothetical protein